MERLRKFSKMKFAISMLVVMLASVRATNGELTSSMSDAVEAITGGTVSITEHPDLGLRTTNHDLKTAFSIASTIAPQINLDDIKPTTSTQESIMTKLPLTEFKMIQQAEQDRADPGPDSSVPSTTSAESSGEGPTSAPQSSKAEASSASVVVGVNHNLESAQLATDKGSDSVIIIDQSENVSQQPATGSSVSPDSTTAQPSEENCNPKLNPNCMPFTTSRSISNPIPDDGESEDPTTPAPDTTEASLLPEVVTSSINEDQLEGFCSESDANCHIEPTAALLTQTEQLQTIDASSNHFLSIEASQELLPTVRPDKNSTGTLEESEDQSATTTTIKTDEKSSTTDDNTIATEETRKKSDRRADGNGGGLPDVNDIINGLLNVVGEGLTIATNFVKEENKRKKDALASPPTTTPREEENLQLFSDDRSKPSRINNRGPPRLSEIPFENIPLEVLSSIQPGQSPVQVQQLPFHSRLKVTKTKRKPLFPPHGATGIPLPQNLLPESDILPTSASSIIPLIRSSTSEGAIDRVWTSSEATKTGPDVTDPVLSQLANEEATKKTVQYFPDNGHVYFPDNSKKNPADEFPFKFVTTESSSSSAMSSSTETTKSTTTSTSSTTSTSQTTQTSQRQNRPQQQFIGPVRPPRPQRPTQPAQVQESNTVRQQPAVNTPTTRTPPLFNVGQVLNERPAPNLVPSSFNRPPPPRNPDIFDVTVSAHQNYGSQLQNQPDVITGKKKGQNGVLPDILTEALPGDQFVSIDGKKTYFDIGPSVGQEGVIGGIGATGNGEINGNYPTVQAPVDQAQLVNPPELEYYEPQPIQNRPPPPALDGQPGPSRVPPAPPVRIDTCIVGDDTTCTKEKNEVCKTSLGISSCYCRPGYGRRDEGKACQKVVQLLMSMQVDRINQARLTWNQNYLNPNSREYRVLEDESIHAISSALSLTSLNTLYISNEVNKFFPMNGKVTVNATVVLMDTPHTRSLVVKKDIQKKLIEVIQARNNNIGNGRLFVDGPLNPIPGVADLNECSEPEMNDCNENAKCINQFGGFTCKCQPGYGDRYSDDEDRSGRYCESCSADHCNGRGTCKIDSNKEKVCECKGNYYGRQCELDGEVVAVAIGASVAAVVIIILTLTCLCLWSRRWKREHQKAEMMMSFPPYILPGGATYSAPVPPVAAANYMANLNKAAMAAQHHQALPLPPPPRPSSAMMHQGTPTLSSDKRSRWIAEGFGQNIYAQVHPSAPAQFQPGSGGSLYSEPIYSHPPAGSRAVMTLAPPYSPPPPLPYARPTDSPSMYGTMPRNFFQQGAPRRRRLLDVHHLNQYATFRLSASELALIVPRQFEDDDGSHQDLMLDEETLRATRFNSKRLTVSLDDNLDLDAGDADSSSGTDDKSGESFAMVQRPPAPPPRSRPFASPERGSEALSPASTCSEKVRSLPSVSSYKPLPPLPADQPGQSEDASSLDSSTQGSPTSSSSGKKHSVTFCDNEQISPSTIETGIFVNPQLEEYAKPVKPRRKSLMKMEENQGRSKIPDHFNGASRPSQRQSPDDLRAKGAQRLMNHSRA